MNVNRNNKFNLVKPRKRTDSDYQPSSPTYYEKNFAILMEMTWCVGGKHYSNTINTTENEKVNPKTKKLVKIIKGSCSICGCDKSQILTK